MRQARQRQSQVCGVHGRGLSGFGQQLQLWPLSILEPGARLISPDRRVVRRVTSCHRPRPGCQAPTNPPSRWARPSRSRIASTVRPGGGVCRARSGCSRLTARRNGRRILYRGGLDRPVVSWAARVGLVRATKQVVDSRPRQAPAGLPRSAHRWRQRRSPGRARARRPRAAARAGHTRRAADRRQRGPGRGPGPPRRRSHAPARDRPRPPRPTAARTSSERAA
jgi:hypothetical protein